MAEGYQSGYMVLDFSRVRIARQEAMEMTLEAIRSSGFPDRGLLRQTTDSCGIENKSDVILAAIQYMRSVEKEGDTLLGR